MNQGIDVAVALRQEEKFEASRQLLLDLLEAHPDDPVLNYQCAWAHDLLGLEREAIPYYERAIENGLAGKDREGAFLGLGSSYRCLGEYHKAAGILQRGAAEFPNHRGLQVFLAMTLYNLGETQAAMATLLTTLAETTSDPSIAAYRNAIAFYADKLDQTW